jgi:arylamine N-acetyltransferase
MASLQIPSLFTEAQLNAFLAHIRLPPSLHSYRYTPSNSPEKDSDFLTQLHIYTITAVPYENLSLHYNKDHSNSIEPEDVYEKVVIDARGRGGYCMELSIFYNHILRALGFAAYTSMVRIRYRTDGVPVGDYIGWYLSLPFHFVCIELTPWQHSYS